MITRKKVYVVGDCYQEYGNMFVENGWVTCTYIEEADLVQFCGGEDVNPSLYGEDLHPTTYYSATRDEREMKIFEAAFEMGIPIAGICRGGQFVHVMCGGKLFQNVGGHGVRYGHYASLVGCDDLIHVSSTHHQMMREGAGEVLMVAQESTFKESMGEPEGREARPASDAERDKDIEVVYHKAMNALCFQPHPEFYNVDHPCQRLYFLLIEEYLFNDYNHTTT